MTSPAKALDEHVKALREAGYQVWAPRDDQADWELAIGSILETFQIRILKPYQREDVRMGEISALSLESIRQGIVEMLNRE